ncbi:MAG TPA: DUF1840 domain-containing protein [Rhizobacter sp.]|nr:DUF1840 domain-containing protein [Rhizobacter sp.]
MSLYRFKSKAAGDVIMMGPGGDQVLRIIGKQPAPKGILQPADMPAAMQAIEHAVAADEALRKKPADAAADDQARAAARDSVSLRQRAWPLLELMKRAQAANQDIVWGV